MNLRLRELRMKASVGSVAPDEFFLIGHFGPKYKVRVHPGADNLLLEADLTWFKPPKSYTGMASDVKGVTVNAFAPSNFDCRHVLNPEP